MTTFQPHLRRIGSFLSNHYWVVRQVVPGHVTRLVSVVLLDGVGAISRTGLITFVAFFVNGIQSDRPLRIPATEIVIGSDAMSLFLLSAGTLVLLLLGGVAIYLAAVNTRLIGRAVHTVIANNVFERIRGLRNLCVTPIDLTRQGIQLQVMRNAVHIGLITETLIRTIQPVIYIVVFTCVAFYLDVRLTLLVAPFAMFLIPVVYGIGRQIHKIAGQFLNSQVTDYAAFVRRIIVGLDGSTAPRQLAQSPLAVFEGSEAVRAYFDGFDKNQLANDKMALAMSAFQAVFLSLVIIAFGYYALNDLRPWGSMLGYILAIHLVVSNVQTLLSHLANLNRLYPQLLDYFSFDSVSSGAGTQERRAVLPGVNSNLTLRINPSLVDSRSEVTLQPGHPLYYCCGVHPGRLEFWKCISPLCMASPVSENLWRHADVVAGEHPPMPTSILDNLVGVEQTDRNRTRVEKTLDEFGLLEEVRRLSQGLGTLVTAEVWDHFSRRLKIAVRLLPVVWSDAFVVLIDGGIFHGVTPDEYQDFLEALSGKVVFLMVLASSPLGSEIAHTVRNTTFPGGQCSDTFLRFISW